MKCTQCLSSGLFRPWWGRRVLDYNSSRLWSLIRCCCANQTNIDNRQWNCEVVISDWWPVVVECSGLRIHHIESPPERSRSVSQPSINTIHRRQHSTETIKTSTASQASRPPYQQYRHSEAVLFESTCRTLTEHQSVISNSREWQNAVRGLTDQESSLYTDPSGVKQGHSNCSEHSKIRYLKSTQ